MRVFLAGATGVIGRRLLPMLVEGGHRVTAMTRHEARTEELHAAGAEPVVADAFDPQAVRDAVTKAEPEVLIHELTSIPKDIDFRRYGEVMATNDRIRIEGTKNLVDAALAAGARRVVAQSVSFIYAPGRPGLRTEGDPIYLEAPEPFARSVRAAQSLETTVTETPGIEGVVLRYGYFYGPGTAYSPDGSAAARVRKRRFPVVGSGQGVWSFVHVDDAAAATVLALDHGSPGIYNIVDEDPAPAAEWLPKYARSIGAKPPRHVPRFLAKLAAGGFVVYGMIQQPGASNEKAKRELGWTPFHPTWRTGFIEAAG